MMITLLVKMLMLLMIIDVNYLVNNLLLLSIILHKNALINVLPNNHILDLIIYVLINVHIIEYLLKQTIHVQKNVKVKNIL